jgi:hypothetical protein
MNAARHSAAWRIAVCCATGVVCPAAYRGRGPATATAPAPAKLLAAAQHPTAATHATPAAPESQRTNFQAAVTDVLRLLDAGVSLDVIRAHIKNSTTPYDLSAEDLVALSERGVPSDLIVAMLTRNGELQSRMASNRPAADPGATRVVRATVIANAPVQPISQSAVYAPEPGYWGPPYRYAYAYPVGYYADWSYPTFGTWWWTAPLFWSGYSPYRHYASSGYRPPYLQRQNAWPDAYPNRLIAGPNWGADRGFAVRPAGFTGRQQPWPDAYPNRLIAGPNWGADRGFAARPTGFIARPAGAPSSVRVNSFASPGARGHGGRG